MPVLTLVAPILSENLMIIPSVTENIRGGERSSDIYSRLLRDRIVFLGTAIDANVANAIIAQLLFLESQDPEKEIYLYLNSPGGSVTDGMAILDTMQFIKAPVSTICVGMAASMGAVLLAGGEPGKRRALPNARVMIHQPHIRGVGGQASDIEITAREILRWKKILNEVLADAAGKSVEELTKDTDRDNFMTADEARDYGLIDEVLRRPGVGITP
jgi:ATP-dependent Clp protease protease subunit